MATGYSAAGHCWATQAEAIDAYYSSQPTEIAPFMSGNNSYFVHKYVNQNGTWYTYSTLRHFVTGDGQVGLTAAPTNVTGICTMPATTTATTTETGLPADFDYTVLGALWAFSFSVVVALYLFGRSAGSIIDIFRPRK
ncbi:hypothetical protein [Thiobacillus sp.]|uniref:hypothetical protein n=1 Tax=Thiobacillus sp. TaxID=924 RepID=UPI0011DA82ED|nr:hypothetical protein [Thiobacillus sp.]TXH74943.1 MAG: hypothetical protein E6Q82_08115 [Thiobacillus sp.]